MIFFTNYQPPAQIWQLNHWACPKARVETGMNDRFTFSAKVVGNYRYGENKKISMKWCKSTSSRRSVCSRDVHETFSTETLQVAETFREKHLSSLQR